MEKALVYELEQIAAIENRIYPINIPEGTDRPCIAYMRMGTEEEVTLDGFTGHKAVTYMLSILCPTYEQMIDIRNEAEVIIKGFLMRHIGTEGIYVQDIDINDIEETFEINLALFRGIIDFTIYYKE